MNLSPQQQQIIRELDDGSLYADPDIISALFSYPHMLEPRLWVSHDASGRPNGYLPVGQFYQDGTLSYIAAMPNSPPVSPTYTPGAEYILANIRVPYFDSDLVSQFPGLTQYMTASAYGLPLNAYLDQLSPQRRKDFRRKLKHAERYQSRPGTLQDVRNAWTWMEDIWDQRPGEFGAVSYSDYLALTLDWLDQLDHSQRAQVIVTNYTLNGQFAGVNCLVRHRYRNQWHCDDYLTWYNPDIASGLGIVSAINNLTRPEYRGCRYNLGTPGLNKISHRHAYKMTLIPEKLRLTQAVKVIRH
ncbi:MAG: hypothetical protein R3F02_01530 [Thiolinea sp.]